MDNHDGARPRRDASLHRGYVHVPRVCLAINQDRNCAQSRDRCRTGNDREGRHDHFVAGGQIERGQCGVEGCRTVADGYAVPSSDTRSKQLLEFTNERAFGGNPARVDAFVEVFAFIPIEYRLINRNHGQVFGHILTKYNYGAP